MAYKKISSKSRKSNRSKYRSNRKMKMRYNIAGYKIPRTLTNKDQIITTLTYGAHARLEMTDENHFFTGLYNLNSLYQPQAGTSEHVAGYSQFNALYRQYQVIETKFSITASSTNFLTFNCYLDNTFVEPTIANIFSMGERSYTTTIPPDFKSVAYRGTIKPHVLAGIPYSSSSNVAQLADQNPNAIARLICFIFKAAQETDCACFVNIKIEYKARLFDAKV